MRRSSQETRAVILAAARAQFGSAGYQGATIRSIAATAGIDPAMVMRYFGNKDQLFAAAAGVDLQLPELSTVDRAEIGAALVGHFFDRWEHDEGIKVLLRSSANNDDAVARLQQIFGGQLRPMIASVTDAAPVRSGLIATQMLGLALCRYVLRLPVIADMSRQQAVELIGPTIQRYLDATIDS
jgi:AcrR family transcriptional regulator